MEKKGESIFVVNLLCQIQRCGIFTNSPCDCYNHEVAVIAPILQRRKLRPRETKQ